METQVRKVRIVLRPKLLKCASTTVAQGEKALVCLAGKRADAVVRSSLHGAVVLVETVCFDMGKRRYVVDAYVESPVDLDAIRNCYGRLAADTWMEGDIEVGEGGVQLLLEFVSATADDQVKKYKFATKKVSACPRSNTGNTGTNNTGTNNTGTNNTGTNNTGTNNTNTGTNNTNTGTTYVDKVFTKAVLDTVQPKGSSDTQALLNATFARIAMDTAAGATTTIQNFATFSRVVREERAHKDPITHQIVTKPASYQVRIVVADELVAFVNNKRV